MWGLDSAPDGSQLASALAMSRDDDSDDRKRACQVGKPDMQGHLVFQCNPDESQRLYWLGRQLAASRCNVGMPRPPQQANGGVA